MKSLMPIWIAIFGWIVVGQANANTYILVPNAAISGYNDVRISGSVNDCKLQCNAMPGCKSFDYHKNSNKCDLSFQSATDVEGLKTDYSGNPYDHYAKLPTPKADKFIRFKNNFLPSRNDRHIPNSSAEACKEHCLSEEDFFCKSYDFRRSDNGCFLSASNSRSDGNVGLRMSTDDSDHYARAAWVNDCVLWSGEEDDLGDAVRIRDSGSRYLRNDVNGAPVFNGVSADGEDLIYQVIDRRVTEAGDFDIRLASPAAGEKVNLPLAVLFKLVFGDPVYPVPATRPLGTIQTSVVLEDNESFEAEGGWFGLAKGTGETRDLGVFAMLEVGYGKVCSPDSNGHIDCSGRISYTNNSVMTVESCDRNFH